MYLKKTPNTHGRIRLSIVDNYYDRVKKCSRQKTIESIGFLDELQKIYEDPIAHFQKRVDQLNEEKRAKQAPINFTFYDSDRLCVGDSLRKNFGYAALSKIYHELEIDKFPHSPSTLYQGKIRCQHDHEDAGLFQNPCSCFKKSFF